MINKGTFRLLLATTIACLAFTGIHAGGYVGASAGQGSTQIQPDPAVTAFDGSGTAYKVLGGYRVMPLMEAAAQPDFIVTATGDKHVVDQQHMQVMEDGCVLANSGHFNAEICGSLPASKIRR